MHIFNFFRKKNKEITKEVQIVKVIDYAPLIKIAKILANDDEKAVKSIKLLVNSPLEFELKHREWLIEMDLNIESMPDIITAYWLTGYDTPFDFGGYIDWKSNTDDVLLNIKNSIKNKKYDINLNDINFNDDDFTDIVLLKINNYLKKIGFILINWNTDSDSYFLFIIKYQDYKNLINLGNMINVRFHSFLEGKDINGNQTVIEE